MVRNSIKRRVMDKYRNEIRTVQERLLSIAKRIAVPTTTNKKTYTNFWSLILE